MRRRAACDRSGSRVLYAPCQGRMQLGAALGALIGLAYSMKTKLTRSLPMWNRLCRSHWTRPRTTVPDRLNIPSRCCGLRVAESPCFPGISIFQNTGHLSTTRSLVQFPPHFGGLASSTTQMTIHNSGSGIRNSWPGRAGTVPGARRATIMLVSQDDLATGRRAGCKPVAPGRGYHLPTVLHRRSTAPGKRIPRGPPG
jgi:hypothetical protein